MGKVTERKDISFNQLGHQDAIDDQSDVVADEQGGDEIVGMPVEHGENAGADALV